MFLQRIEPYGNLSSGIYCVINRNVCGWIAKCSHRIEDYLGLFINGQISPPFLPPLCSDLREIDECLDTHQSLCLSTSTLYAHRYASTFSRMGEYVENFTVQWCISILQNTNGMCYFHPSCQFALDMRERCIWGTMQRMLVQLQHCNRLYTIEHHANGSKIKSTQERDLQRSDYKTNQIRCDAICLAMLRISMTRGSATAR